MEFVHTTEEWLKASILGMVVLGALGSLVAVGALRSAKFLVEKLLPGLTARVLAYYVKFMAPRMYALGYVAARIENDVQKVVVYYLLHIGRLVAFCALSVVFVVFFFALQVSVPDSGAIFYSKLAILIAAQLSGYLAFRAYRMIGIQYRFLVAQIVSEAREAAKQHAKDRRLDEVDGESGQEQVNAAPEKMAESEALQAEEMVGRPSELAPNA